MWEAVLGALQLQVTRPSYVTWLKDTVGLSLRDGRFTVGTPNTFVAEMLEQRMYSLISQAAQRVVKGSVELQFEVVAKDDVFRAPDAAPPILDHVATESLGAVIVHSPQPSSPASPQPSYRRTPLNPQYTFDSFIVGKSNELTHAAAMAVSDRPGSVYNPLVMYSAVGLGKTHLLHAIGHRLHSVGQSLIYSTTEEFTNEYISAIRESRTEEFRNRYRGADVLLLDDLQFLIGKEQTQEGFFHTFNALHMTNRQIVITIDRPVSSLNLLEDRVRSRLGGGLVVDIQAPDLETRLAILRTKSEAMGKQVPSDVLQFLAERVRNNIRELEGALNRLIAYARFTRAAITLDAAKRALNGASTQDGTRQLSPQEIVDTVSTYYRVGAETLSGPRGRKQVALARQVAMYLMRERTGLGPTGIGRVFGGRHHATVIKNCTKIARLLDTDPYLHRDVDSIRDSLTTA